MTEKELNKKNIEEFIKDTPEWHSSIPEEYRSKGCFICGVIPDNLLTVSKDLQDILKALE